MDLRSTVTSGEFRRGSAKLSGEINSGSFACACCVEFFFRSLLANIRALGSCRCLPPRNRGPPPGPVTSSPPQQSLRLQPSLILYVASTIFPVPFRTLCSAYGFKFGVGFGGPQHAAAHVSPQKKFCCVPGVVVHSDFWPLIACVFPNTRGSS